jgi:hypothetical protein
MATIVQSDHVAHSGAMSNHRGGGIDFVRLHQGIRSTPGNFEFSVITTNADYATPRHRHNFDQIHHILSGRHQWGPDQWMPTGSIGYFTEGCFYGPQRGGPATQLALQFGGASGSGFMGYDDLGRGNRELAERGTFDNGSFTWVDDAGKQHRSDGYEAIWEHVNETKLTYPEPRYDKPIIIYPDAMQWRSTAEPGVNRKHAGTFGERCVSVGLVGLAAGTSHAVEAGGTTVLQYLLSGTVTIDGGAGQAPGSAIKWVAGDRGMLTSIDSATLYEIRLPEFD